MTAAAARRPFAELFRLAERSIGAIGLPQRPLVAEALVEAAQRRTGLDDFGGDGFLLPLRVLVLSYNREAELSPFGRLAARCEAVRFLSNLLRLRAEEKAGPVLAQRIDRPLFIMGLPRSGTTFLHMLLAQDPDNAVPLCWQTMHPYPWPGARRDRRAAVVQRQFRLFAWLTPEVDALHPLGATLPQECSEMTAHLFTSLRFDTTHHVPSYRDWLDATGQLAAYRFHRRFLQHLQAAGTRGRWVLKCPDHIFALEALRAVYPDARFVFVHREPTRVLASVARLTEVLRRPFSRRLDRLEIGRQVSLRWADGAQRIIAASTSDLAGRALHIRHTDLVADPLGTVAAMYRHFGLSLPEGAAARMRRMVAARPHGGYGRNAYRMEDYGLEPAAERRRFAAYAAHFGVQGGAIRADRD